MRKIIFILMVFLLMISLCTPAFAAFIVPIYQEGSRLDNVTWIVGYQDNDNTLRSYHFSYGDGSQKTGNLYPYPCTQQLGHVFGQYGTYWQLFSVYNPDCSLHSEGGALTEINTYGK